MLHLLRIKNFAIVDTLEIECETGLSVFTGETGAGKSLLVEALRFLLGGRASVEMIRTGAPAAIVEGRFDWPIGCEDTDIFDGEDPPGEIWIRRELPLKGSGRCFVGDRQITRSALVRLAEHLADLCGQHQQQILLDPRRHTEFLDTVAGHQNLVTRLKQAFGRLSKNISTQDELRDELRRRQSQRELTDFQIAEIQNAAIAPDEDETLKTEAVVLKNARRLAEAAETTLATLTEAEDAVGTRIAALLRNARKMSEVDQRWGAISERLAIWQEDLEDLSRHMNDYRQRLELDPRRLDEIEARLAELHRLKAKYGDTCASVLECLATLEGERKADGKEEDRLTELVQEQRELEKSVAALADVLSQQRRESAGEFQERVNALLAKLGMPSACLRVLCEPYNEGGLCITASRKAIRVHSTGTEAVRFVFEANPEEGFKPLDKIVSGGELSRLLLAFKSVAAARRTPVRKHSTKTDHAGNGASGAPLFLFDEIDSGIGGAVAYAVAKQIKALAQSTQVLLISHLQQMAAAADTHYLTAKDTVNGRARVTITRLDDEARVREVARMVAGDEITDRSLQFAAELTATKK